MHGPEALKHVGKNLATSQSELKLLLLNTQPLGESVKHCPIKIGTMTYVHLDWWMHDIIWIFYAILQKTKIYTNTPATQVLSAIRLNQRWSNCDEYNRVR